MSSRPRPCLPSAASSPLDVDELLAKILLRLPPQPSSLPRASPVCKLWRLLVSDPRFVRRFRIHHRHSPPLLGYFVKNGTRLSFRPTMEAPNRVPPGRLSLQFYRGHRFQPLGCRHGLALFSDHMRQQFLVWDPVSGDQHVIAFPTGFDPTPTPVINGAVFRAAGDHFLVVFLATGNVDAQPGHRAIACMYSSETGIWGELVSTPIPSEPRGSRCVTSIPSVLVGDSLYWQLQLPGYSSDSILEFDIEKQSLAVIRVTEYAFRVSFTVIRADGGGLGLLFVSESELIAEFYQRNTDCDGVASWVLGRIIQLDKTLDSRLLDYIVIVGFAEKNNMVFLRSAIGLSAVQLKSLQFKKLSEFESDFDIYPFKFVYPFESVYTAETDIGGEHDGCQFLHNA